MSWGQFLGLGNTDHTRPRPSAGPGQLLPREAPSLPRTRASVLGTLGQGRGSALA